MPDAGASHEVGATTRADFTYLDPVTCRRRSLLAIGIWTFGKQCLKESVTTYRNKIEQVLDESILVFVGHTCYVVHDITSVMLHQKLGSASLKVRVGSKSSSTLYEAVISCGRIRVCSCGGIVQSSEDSGGAALLNKVADDLVIEILDLRPLDLFTDIFFLLGLQGQFDEDLLQLFIDVVDAELLEGIFLECQMSVVSGSNLSVIPQRSQIQKCPVTDIKWRGTGERTRRTHQNSNQLADCSTRFHRNVDTRDNPLEQIVIDSLRQRISPRASLRRIQRYVVD